MHREAKQQGVFNFSFSNSQLMVSEDEYILVVFLH